MLGCALDGGKLTWERGEAEHCNISELLQSASKPGVREDREAHTIG